MSNTVLVVDDIPAVFEFVRHVAEPVGCDARYASSGVAGLDYLKDNKVELLLVDLQMPGMTGIEFLYKLREREPEPAMPIVLCSGTYSREIAEQARALGVVAVLQKPVEVAELRQLLEAAAASADGA